MQSVVRAISIAYLLFLTLLLLSSDPTQIVRVNWQLLKWLQPWAHALSFFTLAVLALSVRWPMPRWGVLLFLVFYAAMTEIAQGFILNRSREWSDWLMDLAGVAVGVVVCWGTALLAGAARSARLRRRSKPPVDQWEVLQKIMSRPAAEQSWWG